MANLIFSILKEKVTTVMSDPVIEDITDETPVEENTEGTTSEEEIVEETIEEETEPVTLSEGETEPEETTSEETIIEPTEENPEEEPEETTPEEDVENPVEEDTDTETEDETPEEVPDESPTYVIANIIVCKSYEIASRIARCEFGPTALAIETSLYSVNIGDTYKDGVFYDANGNEVLKELTETERIQELEAKLANQAKGFESQAENIALLNETLLEVLMG